MPTIRPLRPIADPAHADELDALAELRHALWDDASVAEHRRDLEAWVAGTASSLPTQSFVAVEQARVVGFVDVGLRSHADGCDPSRPVGYLEGWYVVPELRRRGIGGALVAAAEAWARSLGCREMGSDTWSVNEGSIQAHRALGYEEVDRCVLFRKALDAAGSAASAGNALYGPTLAQIHHAHFGMVAEAAADTLVGELGERRGTVVELAAGSGISARRLTRAGHAVHCVELSAAMVELGRPHAPDADWSVASLWEAELPRCLAVTAIGEALNYAASAPEATGRLGELFGRVRESLEPGGVFLFDLALPGRSGETGRRTAVWRHDDTLLVLDETEGEGELVRRIDTVLPRAGCHRRESETHVLRLWQREEVEAALEFAGFGAWSWLESYGEFRFGDGWRGVSATR